MASTPSPLLRIQLMGTGDQAGTWGDTTNTNLGTLLEGSIAGLASVSVTSADQALVATDYVADQARMAIISLSTTTTANFNVYAPPVSKTYVIQNTSIYDATIYNATVANGTTAAGSGVTVPAGGVAYVFSNGTNCLSLNALYGGSTASLRVDGSGNVILTGNFTQTGNFTLTGDVNVTGAAVFNEAGADKDFRVEGDTDANLLFVDASTDRVGIGTNTPTVKFDVVGAVLVTGNTTLNGAVVVNETGADVDTRIEGDTDVNLVFVDASTDRVGIGTDTPQTKAHIQQTSATTNSVTQVLRLDSQSSGTPAIGIGVGMEFAAETSAGNTEVGVVLEAVTTDINAASEDFDLVFKTMQNGAAAAERVRIRSDGNVGIGTNNPSTILSLSRSSACVAQFANGTASAQVGAFGTNVAAFGSSTNHPTRFLINGSIAAGIETTGDFQFNSGYGSSATAYGCRAWINFNGTTVTNPASMTGVRGSGNVSSVLDNAVGDYTINFTNAMPDTNYSAIVTSEFVSNGTNICFPSLYAAGAPIATGSVRVYLQASGAGGGVRVDATYFCVAIFR